MQLRNWTLQNACFRWHHCPGLDEASRGTGILARPIIDVGHPQGVRPISPWAAGPLASITFQKSRFVEMPTSLLPPLGMCVLHLRALNFLS